MTNDPPHTGDARIRAWLRNELRLGIRHLGVMPRRSAGPRTPSVGNAPPAPAANVAVTPPRSRGPAAPAARGSAPTGTDGLPPLNAQDLREADARTALQQLDEGFVRGCVKCRLCEQRTQTVFGVGRARPEIVFVGEGPGEDEDRRGEPFVGRAGQLLTRMIAAMTLTRDQVYICNVVKCRPPNNRTPAEDEIEACSPYLFRQLAILRPRVIVSLGAPATRTLLATQSPIGKLRGRFHDFPPPALAQVEELPRVPLMPTYHPAYLLRSPEEKGKAWADLKEVMRLLDITIPGGG